MGTYYIPTTRGHGITRISAPDGTGDITIQRFVPQQTIEGFGGSDEYLDNTPLSDAQADMFFDPTVGIGLSILRMGIDENGNNMSFYSNATKAAARGAKIIATGVTALAAQKDNGSLVNGGHLFAASYSAFASTLAAFQGLLQSNASVNLYALEIESEPDFAQVTARSMLYTTAEMTAFVKVIGPLVAALTPRPLLVMPSCAGWDNVAAYAADTLGDATAAPYIDRIGTHQYSGTPAIIAGGKPLWHTEMSYFNTFDATMTQALIMAGDIHKALTAGNVATWIWWWLINNSNADNEGLIGNGTGGNTTVTKRLYVLGNWSKFIRPGYVRVSTTGTVTGVSVTAFLSGKTCVVVAVNTGGSVSLTFGLPGNLSTMIPYLTDATHDLAAQGGVSVIAGVMSTTLPGSSVTSFVGTGA
jgi:glucuronoarabinoxylan endo-1,4-beta-xylanase